jgi:hypothetical protein
MFDQLRPPFRLTIEPIRIARVEPDVVVVLVRHRERLERRSGIVRDPDRLVEDPHRVGVGRVRVDVLVVPGTFAECGRCRAAHPAVAAVVRAEHAAVGRLDDRVHAPRPRGGGDADLAEHTRGQILGPREVRPTVAAVA